METVLTTPGTLRAGQRTRQGARMVSNSVAVQVGADPATPPNPLGVLVGFSAVLRLGGHIYAFGSQDPVKSYPLFVVRWPVQQAAQGDLSNPEWWAGGRLGWVPDSSAAPRQPIFENGQSELTVHADVGTEWYLAVQTQGFGPADLLTYATNTFQFAEQLTDPLIYYPRFVRLARCPVARREAD